MSSTVGVKGTNGAGAVVPQSNSTEEIVAELRRRSSFMFVSHVKPDGDTLGAGLALGLALKQLGKRVGVLPAGSGAAEPAVLAGCGACRA